MKDLRIVVVTWNNEQLIERCLASLEEACRGIAWECIVVDNASADKSVEIVEKIAMSDERFKVVRERTNLGFSKACNIGAKDLDARYVLFLNPDTECPPGSLSIFVEAADADPKAGIFGPKLTNPDGTRQDSVRRFPTVWSQAAILLKLAHVFPWLPTLQKYFAKDLDPEKEQDVDQVMGACFLVRRELIDQKLGFDERYFIWMEEVDLCKAAKEKGWGTRYIPSTAVIHHGGTSFAQVFSVKKQKYFTDSSKKYFAKWHPGWRSWVINIAALKGLLLTWLVMSAEGRWMLVVLGLEAISLATIFTTLPNTIAVCAVTLIIFYLAWKKPTVAMAALALELLIGSKGYLLQFGGWPSSLSLRVLMTAAFLCGWFINFLQHGNFWQLLNAFRTRKAYLVLFIVISYASLRGMMLHNVFALQDANAWGDWILLFPVFDISLRYQSTLRKDVMPVFWVGVTWLAVKSLALEYIFSHGFSTISPSVYLWVRRTGVAEATLITGNAFRLFMQSYVYAVAGWVIAMSWWLTHSAPETHTAWKRPAWWMIVACTAILGLSLSRSFWIGTAAGALCVLVLLSKNNIKWWLRLWGPIAAKLCALLAIAFVLIVPLPPVNFASLTDVFNSRTGLSDAAAVSRWNLFPIMWQKIKQHPILGSGFGATVTYQSEDPRQLTNGSNGMFTTYAFEWGWVDHWIKFGIIGIPLMAFLVLSLLWRFWRLDEPLWLRVGGVSSLVALAVLHFFTPYLNHPLGFLFFFVGEAIILTSKKPARMAQSS